MQSQERFLLACRRLATDRPPVWLMRQAGRYLPEYREIREKYDFLTMCRDPELIAEISLQPWQRFHMDAVIVFSDILLPLAAMGPKLKFEDKAGPRFSYTVRTQKDVENLAVPRPRLSFPYLFEALENLSHQLGEQAALIGFIGSPWTLACYLTEGGSGDFQIAKKMLHDSPTLMMDLMEKITSTILPLAIEQVRYGANVIQIFDTWGGLLTPAEYQEFELPYLQRIISEIDRQEAETILFVRKSAPVLGEMIASEADVLSLGTDINMREAITQIDNRAAIQGNLNPEVLLGSPTIVKKETRKLLETIGNQPGFIANLGHGVLPGTPVESVKAFVETIKNA